MPLALPLALPLARRPPADGNEQVIVLFLLCKHNGNDALL